ncbi:hypothetical protein T2812B_09140 [Thermotoga sp. 2812B]|nr:hypothetical protein T2812B_09140 [Thermotoga sp. 2812B]EJX26383.1 hypothetical protein EMP_02945 [Thermotoga sp. EMP]
MEKMTFGLIVGNREFFPDRLVEEGRERVIKVLEGMGYRVVTLSPSDTKLGAVETAKDAKKCAELFKEKAGEIDGIIVTLPNFGDEKGVAQAIRLSGLNVPVLVHAFPDDPEKLDLQNRRDSFCGKISVCNNLKQYGIEFSLTTLHTEDPESEVFKRDIEKFAAVCKIVKGMRNIKVGAIGARPSAFNTVRFSEKILERMSISVETVDLSEILHRVSNLKDDDERVRRKLEEIKKNYRLQIVPEEKILLMAKFGSVIDEWIEENDIKALAIQCWTSLEWNLGITPCTIMSLLSEKGKPAACEVDITGALSMYVLQLASGQPSAIVDWNNNYRDENETILFHCGNFPASIYEKKPEIKYADVIGTTVGKERAYGACAGKIKTSPFTFLRLTTDDNEGKVKAYVGEGQILDENPKTFGSRGVARIEKLQELMKYICENGFEHHVAINLSRVADAVKEALEKYLGIVVHKHNAEV